MRHREPFYGLVVRRLADGENGARFERMGWAKPRKQEAYEIVVDRKNWTTITLV